MDKKRFIIGTRAEQNTASILSQKNDTETETQSLDGAVTAENWKEKLSIDANQWKRRVPAPEDGL